MLHPYLEDMITPLWYRKASAIGGGLLRVRRVVAKVEWQQGELFPRVGFTVTSFSGIASRVVNFYNRRGTAKQWIKNVINARGTALSVRARPAEIRCGSSFRGL